METGEGRHHIVTWKSGGLLTSESGVAEVLGSDKRAIKISYSYSLKALNIDNLAK